MARVPTSRDVLVFCNACKFGLGAWWGGHWLTGLWQGAVAKRHINVKELTTVRVAVKRWAHLWKGARVFIHTDNQVSVSVCAKGHSRNPVLTKLVREIFWILSRHSCEVFVCHIPSVDNERADRLSRLGIVAEGFDARVR